MRSAKLEIQIGANYIKSTCINPNWVVKGTTLRIQVRDN